jgi:hypothetical protein
LQKGQVRFNELQRNYDLRSGKYDFDLAQRKYEKRQQVKPKEMI